MTKRRTHRSRKPKPHSLGLRFKNVWRKIRRADNKRLYLILFVSLLPVLALIWGGYAILQEFVIGPYAYAGYYTEEEYFPYLTVNDPVAVAASFYPNYPNEYDESGRLQIAYDLGMSLVLSPLASSGADPVCLHEVFLTTSGGPTRPNSTTIRVSETEPAYGYAEPVCGKVIGDAGGSSDWQGYAGTSVFPRELEPQEPLRAFDSQTVRNFPFDTWETRTVYIWAKITDTGDNPTQVRPRIPTQVSLPGWDAEISSTPVTIEVDDDTVPGVALDLSIQRPMSIKIMTVVLLFALFIFITLLLFITENSSALEVGVGILLGLWGVQDILVPDSIIQSTIVHSLIQLLYVYFAAVACIRFISRPIYAKLKSRQAR